VIPSSVLGLVVVAAALGPGYVFVRIEERRRPRPTRSTLLETAELLIIGGFASTMAFAAVAAVAAHTRWLDEEKLAKNSTKYLLSHASRFGVLLLVTLALSYAATWLVARAIFRHRPASIEHISAWDRAFEPKSADALVYITAGLDDGLAVAGDYAGHSVGDCPPDERELILANPEVRASGAAIFVRARDHFVVLRGDRIRTLGVIEYEGVLPKAERHRNWHERVKAWAKRKTGKAVAAR
jgi:hypothetical protein